MALIDPGSPPILSDPQKQIIDARSKTDILITREALELQLRRLEDAAKAPQARDAVPWIASTIASSTSAWRLYEALPQDALIFVVFVAATGVSLALAGLFLFNAYKHRRERNVSSEDILEAIEQSNKSDEG